MGDVGSGTLVEDARELLLERIASASQRVWLASPFLSAPIANRIADSVSQAGARNLRLLTAVDPRSIQSRFLSPDGLSTLLDAGFEIRSIANLHAKVTIVDETWALVGSGNLTESGLGHPGGGNVELGVVLDPEQAKAANAIVEEWWAEASQVSAETIAEYAQLPLIPQSPLPRFGPTLPVPDLGLLKAILAEDPTSASERGYWIDPNYHAPENEAWWERGWISGPKQAAYARGDLIFIYLGSKNEGPSLCPAVVRARSVPRHDPEFVTKERDYEAAERWPWVTDVSVIAQVPPCSGAPLEAADKTYLSVQGHCGLTRAEFEGLARELIARND